MPDELNPRQARRRRVVASTLCLGAALDAAAQDETESTEVWIELSEPVPAGAQNEAQAQRRRQRVSAQQERVALRLRDLGVVELARVVHVRNAILARVAAQQARSVLDIPGVRGLRPARSLHPPRPTR